MEPGYAGGQTKNPTYEQICNGDTGRAEVIKIEFEPSKITYEDLLTVFFASHDPSQLNRQGNDVGTQYRSVIFYTTPKQKAIAEKMIKEIDASAQGKPVVTEVAPLEKFYEAESYHENYYERNKDAPYCQIIINPKVEKVQRKFARLLAAPTQ